MINKEACRTLPFPAMISLLVTKVKVRLGLNIPENSGKIVIKT